MREFNASFAGLSPDLQEQRCIAIAWAALRHYDLGDVRPVFLQHNGGLVFRVDSLSNTTRCLLKIHEPIGTGAAAPAAQIRARLEWLTGLRRTTGLTVQEPIPNRAGELVTSARYADLAEPFLCTLQSWVDGEHPHGDFTTSQTYQIGVLMARLHDFSSQWMAPTLSLPRYDLITLHAHIEALRAAIHLGLLTPVEYATIEAAGRLIELVVRDLGEQPQMWGLIHGDLHHDNLLFYGDEVRPIDFDSLSLAHYYADLGVTLYHIFYQEPAVRRALLDGYHSVRRLPDQHLPFLEAFLTGGAIANLAFQISIPTQQTSELFARNLRQLVDEFCDKLIAEKPFVFV